MKRFNKKRIHQNRTSTTTNDSEYSFTKCLSLMHWQRGESEDSMTVMKIGVDCILPMVINTPGGLKEWYQLLGCDHVETIGAQIGDRHYCIIFDDRAIIKNKRQVSATDKEGNPNGIYPM